MNTDILSLAIQASLKAGEAILEIYENPQSNFEIERKSDQSPLTIADRTAHTIIVDFLKQTAIPILSEEGSHDSFEVRKKWDKLWIVDPLDGTKEFIKKNGEFTVNIALVENGIPTLGVVYIPVQHKLYFAEASMGAYVVNEITTSSFKSNPLLLKDAVKLPLSKKDKQEYVVVASRSHLSEETKSYIDKIEQEHNNIKCVSAGSSIKICWVAEGIADIYPRFAPTMEWDTAAGHAIVLAAGKNIVLASNEDIALTYNKSNLLNPWFVVK